MDCRPNPIDRDVLISAEVNTSVTLQKPKPPIPFVSEFFKTHVIPASPVSPGKKESQEKEKAKVKEFLEARKNNNLENRGPKK